VTPAVRRLALSGLAGVVLAIGAVFTFRAPPTPPPPPAAPAPPSVAPPPLPRPTSVARPIRPPATATPVELAVVAPLAPGSDLGGFVVREIRGVERGRMRVVCEKGRDTVRLDVALDGAAPDAGAGALPPATAGKFAIFYALDGGATPEDGERLAKALAVVIGRGKAPPPPGMTPFTPGPKPPTAL
jgi:hypothetical protein